MVTISKKLFFGTAIGTMIEYYDYALFSIFLPVLSPLFFPANTVYQSLVKSYFILLISMLARPLGGIFFGYLGDSLGRRKALLASIYGISFTTFAIGAVPTYSTLGMFSTFFIMTAKTAQIFCFGGEYNGAGIYVVEHAEKHQEALSGSLLTAMTLFGSLIATFIGIIITFDNMPVWSWRIAFILGGIGGIVGIIYRKNFLESPHFEKAGFKKMDLFFMLKMYRKEILASIFIGGFATVPFTTVLIFIGPVLMTKGFFTSHQLMLLETFLIIVAIITFIPVGMISDRKSPKKVMKWGCWALAIFSFPLLWAIDTGSLCGTLLAFVLLIIINEIFLGPSNAYLKNLFAIHYRYRGSSLGFCLGMSFLGGLTPIVENYLYQWTGRFCMISLWLAFIGLGTLMAINFVGKKSFNPMDKS